MEECDIKVEKENLWGCNCMIIFYENRQLQESSVKMVGTETRGAVILLV